MTKRTCRCYACRARDDREFWRIVESVDVPQIILSGRPVTVDGTVIERPNRVSR